MLTEPSEDECGKRSSDDAERGKALRAKYKSSGVYESGDPNKPLWTFDEDWRFGRVLVANDGSHIVHMGVFGRSTSAEAFTIYRDGKPIRSYRVNELVRDESAVTYTTSMILWSENVSLDDSNSQLNVETADSISYSIDLKTGEIISRERGSKPKKPDETSPSKPASNSPKKFCFGFLIIILGLVGLIIRKSPNQ